MSIPIEEEARYFIRAGVGRKIEAFPGVALTTTAGDQLMLSVVRLETGAIVEEHCHPHEQMGFLVSGRLEFTVGGITRVLEPGDIWRIPGGTMHKVVAIDEPALALDVFHPVREDYR